MYPSYSLNCTVYCTGIPKGTKATQPRSTPYTKAKERKKESIHDIQEQNRVLMEKKLDLQLTHQSQKLLFMKEESQVKLLFRREESKEKRE